MKQLAIKKHAEDILMQTNQVDIDMLFDIYAAQKFIYPEKMERLKPVLSIVRKNWIKAMKLGFPMFCVSTVQHKNITASNTCWQYSNTGMIGQHLTSNHPVGSRIVLLGMIKKIIENQHGGFLESFQIYYRPENKYPSKIFESVTRKAGPGLSENIPYAYFEVPFTKRYEIGQTKITEIEDAGHPGFINFLIKERGELYIKSQELNLTDIKLDKLNNQFEQYGLKRSRRIFVATYERTKQICAVVIVNHASLGLNFSFLENASELILSKNMSENELVDIAAQLINKAAAITCCLALDFMPVIINPAHASILEKLEGKFSKNYNLFILLKGGYEIWYDHVEQVTSNVFSRFINQTTTEDVIQ